ncbi:hypothetical protein ACF0H5_024451 [Mactra antiquata]
MDLNNSNSDSSGDVFGDFCGGEKFWDSSLLNIPTPRFSICFRDTVLTWVSCGYLLVLSPFYISYVHKRHGNKAPLPFTALSATKMILSFLIGCITIIVLFLQEHYGRDCQTGITVTPAGYLASSLKFITFTWTIILQQLQRYRGVKTSAIPFIFWFVLLFTEAVTLYSHAVQTTQCSESILHYIYFILIFVQLICHGFVDEYKSGYQNIDAQEPWAEENASIFSRALYCWFNSVVWKVHKKIFLPEQFWSPLSSMKCEILAPTIDRAWKQEVEHCNLATVKKKHFVEYKSRDQKITEKTSILKNEGIRRAYHDGMAGGADNKKEPNLFLVLCRVFYWEWLEATFYRLIAEGLWLLEPVALQYIIQIAEDKSSAPLWQGIFFCCMLFTNLCISSCFYHSSYHHVQGLGLKVKAALMCLIYNKALSIKRNSSTSSTIGEIVNLMSVDCQRVQDSLTFSFYTVVTFATFGIALIQLWILMGVAAVAGIGIIVLMLPVVGYIAAEQYNLQKNLLYLKGKRIKILNEIISGIKVLKMYAWENSFINKVEDIRNEEIKRLMKFAVLSTINVLFSIHSPFMILFTLLLVHVLMSPTHTLRAEETFTAVSIINIIKFPIVICPTLVNGIIQAKVSIGRIKEFLCQEDIATDSVTRSNKTDIPNAVSIKDGYFSWSLSVPVPTLSNINLHIKQGELVAVVGPVGSGKSSLISACLGEMETIATELTLKGSVAYVPQEAWIQNMTLRDNILFGKVYNERKYRKVIESCALLPDLQILAGGDQTEIGEKGINISGGQKQRINLARAVYNNADVYFLDDPLSAVDSHVGKHLFEKIIGNDGLLKHKTRILVTHGIHWLPFVDKVLVMSDGTITESGTYTELIQLGGRFAEFLQTYLQEYEDDDDNDPELTRLRQQMLSDVEQTKSDGGFTSEEDLSIKRSNKRRKPSSKDSKGRGSHIISKSSMMSIKDNDKDVTSKLTVEEVTEEGTIKPTVLLHFLRAMGIPAVIGVIFTMAAFQSLNVFSNFWLTFWTEDPTLLNSSMAGTTEYEDRFLYYLLLFALQGLIQGIMAFISFYLALTRMVQASSKLHRRMLYNVLHSPMSFFDTTPIGRIMNRFSSDIDIMDNKLPESFKLWQMMIFQTVAVVAVVTISTPIFIAALAPIIVFYVFFVRFYLPTARQMRRIESVRRSPIYNHFSETLTGTSVIRAYQCSERFIEESRQRIDENIKFYYAANTGGRWVGWRVELVGNFVAFLAALFALLTNDLNGAQVGMSITYAVQLTITLNFGVFAISEMEMNVISAERVTEYTSLPSEAEWEKRGSKLDPYWPTSGRIEFQDYKTRYRPGLELVLCGIKCTIKDGEKVGIVGRTGAGKSSLAMALFRLIESADGMIKVDGVDISTLGLHELRQKLTILPQEPVLFSGTIRNNLDPFGHYCEDSLWYALECAHLKDFVINQNGQLEYECGEAGQNLSVGQRQLVCLARTLLHKTKILILDEATSAVDMETDELIQETIRTQFTDCTILAVAHRLNTILDYDRVLVLDKGLIVEFDSPKNLLDDQQGVFYSMAKDAGIV